MEFKEIQQIWANQEEEKRFEVDERVIHQFIKEKGRSSSWLLGMFDWVMIGVNLFVGSFLLYDTTRDQDPTILYLMPLFFIGIALWGSWRAVERMKTEKSFPKTMLGELDKGIWQMEYMLNQGHMMMRRYIIPMVLVFMITMIYEGDWLSAILFPLLFLPATYYGMRWEARRWHIPKKEMLKELRDQLNNDKE